MASKDLKMSKQCTAAKRKHVTLAIHQKLKIIRRLKSGENQRKVMASYNNALSTIYDTKKWKDQLQLFVASNESVKDVSSDRH
jgi:hypothetical protein